MTEIHSTKTDRVQADRRAIASHELVWRKSAHGLTLHLGRGRGLLDVVPDGTYPGMWRIQTPDGRRSDMVNLTRAKDAAVSVALAIHNRQKQTFETPAEAPPVALEGATATSEPEAGWDAWEAA